MPSVLYIFLISFLIVYSEASFDGKDAENAIGQAEADRDRKIVVPSAEVEVENVMQCPRALSDVESPSVSGSSTKHSLYNPNRFPHYPEDEPSRSKFLFQRASEVLDHLIKNPAALRDESEKPPYDLPWPMGKPHPAFWVVSELLTTRLKYHYKYDFKHKVTVGQDIEAMEKSVPELSEILRKIDQLSTYELSLSKTPVVQINFRVAYQEDFSNFEPEDATEFDKLSTEKIAKLEALLLKLQPLNNVAGWVERRVIVGNSKEKKMDSLPTSQKKQKGCFPRLTLRNSKKKSQDEVREVEPK
ncbi:hypothetical protein PTTG_12208 [Puccinia triticina 1-1 BBBD Race 1]|uniref:Uncharacterized protein n=2 Tax=Puccinia triticina TaxID=208348 RepID=A0A180GF31_PUCT1|nr:uncharacterized protein PtA15_1A402 [Puccinia triticina]OAV91184.1 hypothetical protein PTTG_12208 [Puccinia triticina 1-1 BBBD Race 1]WAQ81064.1 hypothetical protein PtA15_1A402 [Puccinia triticina]WAR51957.1 hypothetical protein PtB15_1B394 [Puccinia triticina]